MIKSSKSLFNNKLILFLVVFLDMMGFSIIFPIFPEILNFFNSQGNDPTLKIFIQIADFISPSKDLKIIAVLLGGISGSIYSFLQFIFAPLWGKISDNVGRKPVLIFTSLGNLLGYIVWLFSHNFTLFVLSRLVTGSMGGNISVASASMADSTSPQDRAKGMGIIGAGIGLGFIFGPPIGGFLSNFNFAAYFPELANHITCFPLSALFSIFIASLNLLLILFLYKETFSKNINQNKKIHPIFEFSHLKKDNLFLIALIYFLFMFSFSGFEFVINFFLSGNFFFSPNQIGMTFVFIGMVIILVQGGIIRKISGKISEINICISGAISLIIGFVLLINFKSIYFVFVAFSFLATGSALLNPGLSSLASLNSHVHEQGKNLGIIRSFGSLARALSPITFCLIYFINNAYISFLISLIGTFIFLLLLVILKKQKINQN